MTRTPIPADAAPVQSYPTFWDMIPVESPQQTPSPPASDAYALFDDAAEGARPVSLSVDRVDVG